MVTDASRSGLSPESAVVVRAVTVIIGVVVGLTFLFGFGTCSVWPSVWACLSGSRHWSRLPSTYQ
jgi:hypothetical protein